MTDVTSDMSRWTMEVSESIAVDLATAEPTSEDTATYRSKKIKLHELRQDQEFDGRI